MKTQPLFPNTVETTLWKSFDDWLAPQIAATDTSNDAGGKARTPLSPSSAKNYRDMWATFVVFCTARGLTLQTVQEDDLELFSQTRGTKVKRVKGTELSDAYMSRFLRMLKKITLHAAAKEGVPANQAADAMLNRDRYKHARAKHREPLPEYFDAVDARRLIDYVTLAPIAAPQDGETNWKAVRDRTAVALMLGGGCTPIDVRNLLLAGVRVDRHEETPKLSLPGNGNCDPRETPLEAWAAKQLRIWMDVRKDMKIAGDLVFPSDETGHQWSETQCHEQCKLVLEKAGLEATLDGGIYKLRHTFVLRHLANEVDLKEVAAWLGIKDANRMEKYRNIVYKRTSAS